MSVIRVRVALAVVHEGKILLVPHYDTDAGAVQWTIPGGRLEFGEAVRAAAEREFEEETGLRGRAGAVLDVSEVILRERLYHSVTITFRGTILGGALAAEEGHPYGEKVPRWFSAADLIGLTYHPARVVEQALATAARQGPW